MRHSFSGQTAIVCGGSQGIGKDSAHEVVRRGGNVCLVARNAATLAQTQAELERSKPHAHQFIDTISCDASDMNRLQPLLDDFVARRGTPDLLINSVGYASPQYVEQLTPDDFRRCMDINYYGQLTPILALLPHFKRAGRGHIANVSSMLGYFGMMGYAAYAPTKFALIGLTEALRNELKPHGITFSILYPPDTDTPGYATENQTKPAECLIMSEGARLMSSAAVARHFVDGIEKKRYAILPGDARLVWRIQRHFPALLHWILDRSFHKARLQTRQQTERTAAS